MCALNLSNREPRKLFPMNWPTQFLYGSFPFVCAREANWGGTPLNRSLHASNTEHSAHERSYDIYGINDIYVSYMTYDKYIVSDISDMYDIYDIYDMYVIYDIYDIYGIHVINETGNQFKLT